MAKISERLAIESKPILDKIFQTEFVQKVIVAGDSTGHHKQALHRFYRFFHDYVQFSASVYLKFKGELPHAKLTF